MASDQGFPGQRVVCFTEAPMEVAWTMVQNTRGRRIQLQPYGVVFNKRWARSQGANPVWYIDATPSGHDWLSNHVNAMIEGALAGEKTATGILRLAPFFEPIGDWRALGGTQREFSWEREWRKVGDLPFTLNDLVGVLAPAGEHMQIRAAIAQLGGANEVRFYEPNQSLGEQCGFGGTNTFALTAIAIAGAMLLLAVGCAVFGDPNPCDRTQVVRDALEEATGRDCDLITQDDLADVQRLHLILSSEEARNLKKGDFSGLDSVETLDFAGGGTSRYHATAENVTTGALHANSFEAFGSLPNLNHLMFARVASSSGRYCETDSIATTYFRSRCFGPDISVATPVWFGDLSNLNEVSICTVSELPSDVSVALKERGVAITAISACSPQEGGGRKCERSSSGYANCWPN